RGNVTITASTFQSNTAFAAGGALSVIGSLSIAGTDLIQNSTSGTAFAAAGVMPVGGGVYVSGTAALDDTLFLTNTAFLFGSQDNVAGGGGLAALGSLNVRDSE